MSEDNELKEYNSDPRTPCRYGLNCYQKNAAHREKFKHPPKKNLETVEEEDKANTVSPKNTEKDKHKKKNLLTDWLKSPPNKKQKVDGNFKDKNIKPGTSQNSSKDKLFNSPNSEIKKNRPDKNIKPNVEVRKTIEIIHNNFKEDERKEMSEETKSERDNKENNKKNESTTSISIVPLQMDVKSKIKKFFLVDMPDDFYKFWSFCESMGSLLLAKGNPLDAFKSVGLTLVGPFDVLANKFNDNIVYDSSALLRHYRYYYDVPEFQTVIKGDEKTGFHMGYFRDDPKENPVFVASNCAEENGIIKSVAENLFGAVNVYLEDYKKAADPFAKLKIVKLQNSLTTWANKNDITLSKSTVAMKKREAAVVTRTFHKAGLVVPYNKKTELGYRELAESDATIKGILTKFADSKSDEERKEHYSKLYSIINFANIANDECDFGTSLELGLDLFTFGSPLLHETAKRLMVTSYKLLGRDEFADIIEAHLQDRQKGTNLSILKKN